LRYLSSILFSGLKSWMGSWGSTGEMWGFSSTAPSFSLDQLSSWLHVQGMNLQETQRNITLCF